ncbi:MAG: TIGR04013 family B12-binding domain/radical SAM domain-containing protein, partial [Polyangia bacterium]|nr:TIGR04013 family B12-binding domain/radical SAM domain-containing protein [Polyangia bacterium]
TEADREATRNLMRHLVECYGARINNHVFSPLPGTPLGRAPKGQVDPVTRRLAKELIGRGHAAGHDLG